MARRIGVAVLLFSLLQWGSAANNPEPMDGYSPSHAIGERDWELKFRNLPDPDAMRDSMQRLSAHPHNVGSAYDKENAEWILSKFQQYGFDAHIETFDVLFPTPKERHLELIEPRTLSLNCKSRPSASIRPRNKPLSNCRLTMPTPPMETSPHRWCM